MVARGPRDPQRALQVIGSTSGGQAFCPLNSRVGWRLGAGYLLSFLADTAAFWGSWLPVTSTEKDPSLLAEQPRGPHGRTESARPPLCHHCAGSRLVISGTGMAGPHFPLEVVARTPKPLEGEGRRKAESSAQAALSGKLLPWKSPLMKDMSHGAVCHQLTL